MRIDTPKFLHAEFFMKDEIFTPDDNLPQVVPSQVHDKNIIHVRDENFTSYILPERPKDDGVLLTTAKAQASLRFADCAPVMLWGRDWAMILHSGYKGTVLNISGEGLKLIEDVKNTCAWIGPCIGREIYCRDIDDEWTRKGLEVFHANNYDVNGNKVYFDLAGEIKTQLLDAGLNENNITLSGIDTFKDSRCYSYRRGDIHERMTLTVKNSWTNRPEAISPNEPV